MTWNALVSSNRWCLTVWVLRKNKNILFLKSYFKLSFWYILSMIFMDWKLWTITTNLSSLTATGPKANKPFISWGTNFKLGIEPKPFCLGSLTKMKSLMSTFVSKGRVIFSLITLSHPIVRQKFSKNT